jgi:hypothetical protein
LPISRPNQPSANSTKESKSATSSHPEQTLTSFVPSQPIRVLVLHILRDPQDDRAIQQISYAPSALQVSQSKTHLSITNPLATKFAIPIHNTANGNVSTCPTIYLSTKTVTPPAIPPAKNAKPKNSTTRAFHATPEPEYEKESAESRVFSMLLMINIPRVLKIKGSQSMNLMWMSDPLRALCDQTEASRRA